MGGHRAPSASAQVPLPCLRRALYIIWEHSLAATVWRSSLLQCPRMLLHRLRLPQAGAVLAYALSVYKTLAKVQAVPPVLVWGSSWRLTMLACRLPNSRADA